MPDLPLVHLARPGSGAAPHPGLVLLHGLGADERDLHSLAGELDRRLVVLSPRAPMPFAWGGYTWFDLDAFGPDPAAVTIEQAMSLPGVRRCFDVLSAFLTGAIDRYDIDPSRLYLGGFSLGAAVAGAHALLAPERTAGALLISGFLPADGGDGLYRPEAAPGRPFFQGHGIHDPIVPVAAALRTRDMLAGMPIDLAYREYPVAHAVAPAELEDVRRWLTGVLDGRPERVTPDR